MRGIVQATPAWTPKKIARDSIFAQCFSLRIPDSYDAKIAKICNIWTFLRKPGSAIFIGNFIGPGLNPGLIRV